MGECDHEIIWYGKGSGDAHTGYCRCSITDNHLANIIRLLANRIDEYLSIADSISAREIHDDPSVDYEEAYNAEKQADALFSKLETFLAEQEIRKDLKQSNERPEWTTTAPLFPPR